MVLAHGVVQNEEDYVEIPGSFVLINVVYHKLELSIINLVSDPIIICSNHELARIELRHGIANVIQGIDHDEHCENVLLGRTIGVQNMVSNSIENCINGGCIILSLLPRGSWGVYQ